MIDHSDSYYWNYLNFTAIFKKMGFFLLEPHTTWKPHWVALSVATAIADVFRKNGINVGREFAKIMKILGKTDDVKSRGVI